MEEAMRFRYMPILVVVLASAAGAQQAQTVAPHDPMEQPQTRALNDEQAAHAMTEGAVEQMRQDQYERDRAAFRAEVAARRAKIANDQAAYERQQAAYADAMAAWRRQSDACKGGDKVACEARTPVPADFYTP